MKKIYKFLRLRKPSLFFLCSAFLLSGNLFGQLNGTYTIGTIGTEDYTSFTEAVTALTTNGINGNVVFNVSNGNYNEQISIPEITGASKTDTIIFQSASGDTADVKIYYDPATTDVNYTIHLAGVDHIRFKNISIVSEGAGAFGNIVKITDNTKDIVFSGNHFYGKTGACAFKDKYIIRDDVGSIDTNLHFINNTFEHGIGAIYSEYQTNINVTNNTFINGESFTILFSDCEYVIFDKNYIDDGSLYVYYTWGNSSHIIKNNTIIGQVDLYSLNTTDGKEAIVYNNFIKGALKIRSCNYTKVFNNTIICNNYYPIWIKSTSSEIKILNNIIKSSDSGYPALYIEDIASIDTLDFNNLYSPGSKLVTLNTTDYATLADWQAAVNQSANSYNVDINFVDEANADLHIADGEPDLFGTTFTGINSDIDGESRHETNPNIGADEYSLHPLSGTYTIGTNGTEDYESFSEAVEDLIYYGISGNTTFNVSSGTYDEQIVISAISGASETSSVMFQSATGNREDVILTNTPDPALNFVVKYDGADYIYFQKMTFQVGSDTNNGTLILMDNGANYNAIMYCDLIGHETSSTAVTNALIYSTFGTSIDEMNIIANNNFTNGSFGVYFTGIDNASMEKGNEISNNVFIDQHEASVYLYYQDSCVVKYDSISNYSATARTSVPYGIYLKECKKENIYNNYIILNAASGVYGGYGLYVQDGLGDIDNRGVIYNNIISVYVNSDKVTLGITLRNSAYRDVIYNSVNITGSYSSSQAFKIWGTSDWYVAQNNIFSNQAGGYAIYSDISTDFASDYNDIYSDGSIIVQQGANSCATLEEWQTVSSKDEHSLSVDPQFVSNTDLHIYYANADLDGAGTQIAYIDRDIDYDDRDDTNPDIGADEYDYISDQNDFLTYIFTEQTGDAIINIDNHTVSIEVAYGTNISSLVATFTISENATVAIVSTEQVSGVTENDFSSPVTYTITAEDASEQNWIVTVTEALNDENDFLTFSFAEQSGTAIIHNDTIIIEVVFGTDLTDLVATFTLSPEATAKIGTTDQVSGTTANDFTSDVTYTIHAEDGTTQDWIVMVTIDENTENDILTFTFPEQNDPAVINATDHTVQIELVPGSSLYGLTATFTLSENAHAYVSGTEQASGTTSNDFDTDVVYTIIAHDDTEQEWTVTVSVEPYHGNDFLTFSFAEQTGDAVIDSDNHTIDVEVNESTNIASLVASFTISDGATIDIDGTSQTSGVTENDFSTTVSYDITAEDGNSQAWVVNVTVEDNSTGIEDLEELEFVLYPNPATDYINIKCSSIKNELIVLEIFDITGRIISSKQIFLNNDLNITFNFNEEVPTGIYLLNISTENKSYTKRFIIK